MSQASVPAHRLKGIDSMTRRFVAHPALALGSTLLWGVIELLALFRSRWSDPGRPGRG